MEGTYNIVFVEHSGWCVYYYEPYGSIGELVSKHNTMREARKALLKAREEEWFEPRATMGDILTQIKKRGSEAIHLHYYERLTEQYEKAFTHV